MSFHGKQILLIDPVTRHETESLMRGLGMEVRPVNGVDAALEAVSREEFDMALVDVGLSGSGADGILARLRARQSVPSILVLTGEESVRRAIRALEHGADDYLVRPLDRSEVVARLGRILEWQHAGDRAVHLQEELSRKYLVGNLVSRSEGMQRVRDQILQVAGARSTVLIMGESGVGKELVAKAIHYNSPRREAPFIAINCSAIPVNLIESELFGHERGAFTGAVGRQKGKFELADGGTILLDEVGDMDLLTQAKLLRVLEERAFMRVGGGREVRVDVRVVAATNTDLEDLIRRRRFREDLYFRLKVIGIFVPPLRDRQEDIPELARVLLEQICRENGLRRRRLTARATAALQRYSWPGNVRELKNVLESTAITRAGEVLRESDLPNRLSVNASSPSPGGRTRAGSTLREMERELIRRTLSRHEGNRTHAARALRIGVRTLQRKIQSYGIRMPSSRGRRPAAFKG
ncbi:MAG TPA: sigma-54 dependent transcriptional regulator [Candidatus Polarisedimenticolia bacterium]|nr:sigma-54 dependent transcriptional regulator [Candidatus Polarisedimenticolia bacterium]